MKITPKQKALLELLRSTGSRWLMECNIPIAHRLKERGLVKYLRPGKMARCVVLTQSGRSALSDAAAREQLAELQPQNAHAVSV